MKDQPKTEPTTETPAVPVTRPTILLAPITEYPAYIHDQCGAIWGIPASLQGEGHKELIRVKTLDGSFVPASELDFFTIDGVIYLVHKYAAIDSTGASVDAIDYYRQERDTIEQVETIPQKPEPKRVAYNGVKWMIETSIINGVEFSYLYNKDEAMINRQGNHGGKGAYMGCWSEVTGFAELDSGILIMTDTGARFFRTDRADGNPVSEHGRLWK